jgi:hypothetical protein
MENLEIIKLLYILFIWFVVLHTFEEIAQGIFGTKVGRIKITLKKYLIGASIITTINLGTLSLIVYGSKIGLYIAIFTTSIFGIIQVIVHTIGFIQEGGKARRIGAGFYSSIPLSIVAGILLYIIIIEIC